MPRIPTLVTDRLILRPTSPGDLADIVALGEDPEVMRYIGQGKTLSPKQSAFWMECMLADARHGSPALGCPEGLPGWMVIIERASQACAGFAVLGMLPTAHVEAIGHELCPAPCVEIGYRLAQPFWGKGYATEAGSALMAYGCETLKLAQIVGIADVRNLASNRVLEKLGLLLRKTYEMNGISIHFRSTDR